MKNPSVIYPSEPEKIINPELRYDSFTNKRPLYNKKKNHLPAMGWNSWNAFGSGNTSALTKSMADKIVELGLDKLGYKFLVLDDGCYKAQRVENQLSNDEIKFPEGFKALSDYIHTKGLKFGMYNDIGTNLCAGAEVGTCGHEKIDAKSYIDWGVDFLKIDNCYYLWDNATFSNAENARYVFAPNIKEIKIFNENFEKKYSALTDGRLNGQGGIKTEAYVSNIGTFDGTNTGTTPVGCRSSELIFDLQIPESGKYSLVITYATGKENETGEWLQVATGNGCDTKYFYDYFLAETSSKKDFVESQEIILELDKGKNILRLMNHRRQENTLCSYAAMLEGLNLADPKHDIILSLCEWGKTQPQNWGFKVADSWRILNDITFRVGSDGNPGYGAWTDPGTPSVTSQYNKAVIMNEFAGLDKGWNDPDMLMIGMTGLNINMNKTHFTMWCMMNSPLMLGLDLRRVTKNDELYNIITNKDLIELNQDWLGIQAKRIWTSIPSESPDKDYIQDINRSDLLIKPLYDGSIALSYINLSESEKSQKLVINKVYLADNYGIRLNKKFMNATKFKIKNLWTKEESFFTGDFEFPELEPCQNITVRLYPEN